MAAQNDNFRIEAPKPIDDRYLNNGVPYADVAEVNATIALTRRYRGLPVLIGSTEYWYRDGITNGDLVIKSTGSGDFRGGWNASGNTLPVDADALGSGAAGAIMAGNTFYFTAPGSFDPLGTESNEYPTNTMIIAKQNSPTLHSHWLFR